MEAEKALFLWRLVEVVLFVLPIGALIWKAAKQAAQMENMKKQISALENKVLQNEAQAAKDIAEIKSCINEININNATILTTLSFIREQIEKKGSKQ